MVMIPRRELSYELGWLITIALCLTVIGFIFIYSASSVYALERTGQSYYFLKKQMGAALIGTVLGLFLSRATKAFIESLIISGFIGSLLLTMGTFIPGLSLRVHGAARWVSVAGFSFQPSETLAIFFVLYVALFLSRKTMRESYLQKKFLLHYAACAASLGLLLIQPDFGSVVTLAATGAAMLYVSGLRLGYFAALTALSVPLVGLLVLMQPYRMRRILTFLNPWSDPQGKGFQIIQSLIAIGSGNWWGLGIARSRQKFFYLPMQHTDFIFPIIAEETGFIGALFVIMLYILFLFYGLKIVVALKDRFSQYMVAGFVVLITLRAIINLMVTCGLVPTKGLGLPFVSYGGTSLIASFAMLGLIISAVRHHQAQS